MTAGEPVRLLPGLHSGLNPHGEAHLAPLAGQIGTVLDPRPDYHGDVLVEVPSFGALRVQPVYLSRMSW